MVSCIPAFAVRMRRRGSSLLVLSAENLLQGVRTRSVIVSDFLPFVCRRPSQFLGDSLPVRASPKNLSTAGTFPKMLLPVEAPGRYSLTDLLFGDRNQLAAAGHAQ